MNCLFPRRVECTVVLVVLLAICTTVAQASETRLDVGTGTTILFATTDQAIAVLTQRDEYVRRMSPFDRAAKIKSDRNVSEEEYLAVVAENIVVWDDGEKKKVAAALQGVRPMLEQLSLPFPPRVLLIKTSGNDEGGAAYTRGDAIVLPKKVLDTSPESLERLICHELFHVLSRHNPRLREKLYTLIGFENCGEVELPAELLPRKITNPDAPRNEHCIQVHTGDQQRWVVPVLFSSRETYDVNRGGEFFAYLQFKLLVIERERHTGRALPMVEGQRPRLIDVSEVTGFYEQIGSNTAYIIHPEEILAENFALLVLGERDLASPEIVEKMAAMLTEVREASRVEVGDDD